MLEYLRCTEKLAWSLAPIMTAAKWRRQIGPELLKYLHSTGAAGGELPPAGQDEILVVGHGHKS